MLKVGIINVTGYAGAEIARLLARHPGVQLSWVTGRGDAGKPLGSVFPHLAELDLPVLAEPPGGADLVFLALPHHASAEMAAGLLSAGARVVDLSADFRLRDVAVYNEFYGAHAAPELLADAVYGLPEVYRSQLAGARLVANPGCYPTASVLAVLPAIMEGVVGPGIIVDAKSGVSGAGRTLALGSHFSEVNENVKAYGLDGHRHWPEILQEMQAAAGSRMMVRLTFIPHLIPMTRGILATAYAEPTRDITAEQVRDLYQEAYSREPFVRVVSAPPQTKQVLGSNYCFIYPTVDRAGRLVVVSVIDNLVKGAAGQAVQNMNLMLGLGETDGLAQLPLYP
jgi:N-acetyl-gamma-glutamyl-phosphate reductase